MPPYVFNNLIKNMTLELLYSPKELRDRCLLAHLYMNGSVWFFLVMPNVTSTIFRPSFFVFKLGYPVGCAITIIHCICMYRDDTSASKHATRHIYGSAHGRSLWAYIHASVCSVIKNMPLAINYICINTWRTNDA